ncbi:MAG: hypothetical protein AAF236_12370 [Verrucomicrobiota bacterium]
MQAKPFKFRYINRIVGAFLLIAGGILLVLLIAAMKTQGWLDAVSEYRVEMTPRAVEDSADISGGTQGIKPGSAVRVIGNQVGFVERVELCEGEDLTPIQSFEGINPEDIRIVAVLRVKGEFANFIGPGSEAILKYDLGGLGSAYFDISRGTGRFEESLTLERPFRILPFQKETDAKEELFATVKLIEERILPAVDSFKATADTATEFIDRLSSDDEVFYRALASLEQSIIKLDTVLARIESGEGALGDMTVADSPMRRELNDFAVTLNRSSEKLEVAIENLDDGIANLDQGVTNLREVGVASFNEAAESFPTTVRKTNATIDDVEVASEQLFETLREIEIFTEALQKHWLVRRHVVDPVEDPQDQSTRRGLFAPAQAPSPDSPQPSAQIVAEPVVDQAETAPRGGGLFKKPSGEGGGLFRRGPRLK